jgi:hypothetical protein
VFLRSKYRDARESSCRDTCDKLLVQREWSGRIRPSLCWDIWMKLNIIAVLVMPLPKLRMYQNPDTILTWLLFWMINGTFGWPFLVQLEHQRLIIQMRTSYLLESNAVGRVLLNLLPLTGPSRLSTWTATSCSVPPFVWPMWSVVMQEKHDSDFRSIRYRNSRTPVAVYCFGC